MRSFWTFAPRDPDAVKFIGVADPGKEDQGTTRSWQEGSGAPPWFREAIADAVATGIEQGVKATQAAYAEQLHALQRELQKVSEYGPRVQMSRAFPSRPDELLDLGIKLMQAPRPSCTGWGALRTQNVACAVPWG